MGQSGKRLPDPQHEHDAERHGPHRQLLYNLPFGADELQQIRSRWDNFDNLIMYLTEGIDKGRAKARGGIEELKTWRNCFIFTGEEPVTKDNSGGGTKNRVIEVEVTKPIYESGYLVANTIRGELRLGR